MFEPPSFGSANSHWKLSAAFHHGPAAQAGVSVDDSLSRFLGSHEENFEALRREATPRDPNELRLAAPRDWRDEFQTAHPDLPSDRGSLYAFWRMENPDGEPVRQPRRVSSDSGDGPAVAHPPEIFMIGGESRCANCGRFVSGRYRHHCPTVDVDTILRAGGSRVRVVRRDDSVYFTRISPSGEVETRRWVGLPLDAPMGRNGFPTVEGGEVSQAPNTRIGTPW